MRLSEGEIKAQLIFTDRVGVNIRTVTNPILPTEVSRVGSARGVKTDTSSEDRDANGRREQNDEPNKDPLSDEEMKKAQEYLENLTGLKANGLTIEISGAGELKTFLIKNDQGQVVRRILEWEMRALISGGDKKSGQIFDKAA
jgi:hypothetical protein